eukprot:m.109797 g.109797  ORF g.109797 m.109797 type:complete len:59 (-) comp15250_c1_seq4:53-229(-)
MQPRLLLKAILKLCLLETITDSQPSLCMVFFFFFFSFLSSVHSFTHSFILFHFFSFSH